MKSNFADIEKIEETYLRQIKDNFETINNNKLTIEKHKEYIKNIEVECGNVIKLRHIITYNYI